MSVPCCVSPFRVLGCLTTCDVVDTGMMALVEGVYTAYFSGANMNVKKELTLNVGDKLAFSAEGLNENLNYTLLVIAPTGFNVLAGNEGWSFNTNLVKYII